MKEIDYNENDKKFKKFKKFFWRKRTSIVAFSMIYVPLNIFITLCYCDGIATFKDNNKYFIINHGTIIREISKKEYDTQGNLLLRTFMSVIILLTIIAVLLIKEKIIELKNKG
ncbi:MAG: hypothetical protein Q8942_15465 [Bacillota bacterium]|nr:hypothetical protein [Bacillota bacterium]